MAKQGPFDNRCSLRTRVYRVRHDAAMSHGVRRWSTAQGCRASKSWTIRHMRATSNARQDELLQAWDRAIQSVSDSLHRLDRGMVRDGREP